MAPRILIVAYGNPLRCDDGIAWHVADLLRKRLSPSTADIVCAHQLTPEFAETLSQARGAIFIDAREGGEPGRIYQAQVVTAADSINGTHVLAPSQVAAICSALYGVSPEACEISVAGECFAHGEQLSCRLKDALPEIAAIVSLLIAEMEQRPGGECILTPGAPSA
jgi:hydrogenase maturation protease